MGYITSYIVSSGSSQCTKELAVSWTPLGRQYLSGSRPNRVQGITIAYFTLGDSDINYNLSNSNIESDKIIPSITGVANACLNGTRVQGIEYMVNLYGPDKLVIYSYAIGFRISGPQSPTSFVDIIQNGGQSIFTSPSISSNQITSVLQYAGLSPLPGFISLFTSLITPGQLFTYNVSLAGTTSVVLTLISVNTPLNLTYSSPSAGNAGEITGITQSTSVVNNPNNPVTSNNNLINQSC